MADVIWLRGLDEGTVIPGFDYSRYLIKDSTVRLRYSFVIVYESSGFSAVHRTSANGGKSEWNEMKTRIREDLKTLRIGIPKFDCMIKRDDSSILCYWDFREPVDAAKRLSKPTIERAIAFHKITSSRFQNLGSGDYAASCAPALKIREILDFHWCITASESPSSTYLSEDSNFRSINLTGKGKEEAHPCSNLPKVPESSKHQEPKQSSSSQTKEVAQSSSSLQKVPESSEHQAPKQSSSSGTAKMPPSIANHATPSSLPRPLPLESSSSSLTFNPSVGYMRTMPDGNGTIALPPKPVTKMPYPFASIRSDITTQQAAKSAALNGAAAHGSLASRGIGNGQHSKREDKAPNSNNERIDESAELRERTSSSDMVPKSSHTPTSSTANKSTPTQAPILAPTPTQPSRMGQPASLALGSSSLPPKPTSPAVTNTLSRTPTSTPVAASSSMPSTSRQRADRREHLSSASHMEAGTSSHPIAPKALSSDATKVLPAPATPASTPVEASSSSMPSTSRRQQPFLPKAIQHQIFSERNTGASPTSTTAAVASSSSSTSATTVPAKRPREPEPHEVVRSKKAAKVSPSSLSVPADGARASNKAPTRFEVRLQVQLSRLDAILDYYASGGAASFEFASSSSPVAGAGEKADSAHVTLLSLEEKIYALVRDKGVPRLTMAQAMMARSRSGTSSPSPHSPMDVDGNDNNNGAKPEHVGAQDQKHKQELEDLRSKLEALQKENRRLEESHASDVKRLRMAQQSAYDRDLEREVAERKAREQLKGKNLSSADSAALATMTKRVRELEGTLERARASEFEFERVRKAGEARLAEVGMERDGLVGCVAELRKELRVCGEKLAAEERARGKVEEEWKRRLGESEAKRGELEEGRVALEKKEEELGKLTKEIEEVRRALSGSEAKLAQRNDELGRAKEETGVLSIKLKEAEAREGALRREVEEKTILLASRERALAEMSALPSLSSTGGGDLRAERVRRLAAETAMLDVAKLLEIGCS